MSRGKRKKMSRRDHPELSLSHQYRLVSISRSSFYYQPKSTSAANLALMEQIDKLFTKCPFYRSRQMVRALARKGSQAICWVVLVVSPDGFVPSTY